MELECTMDEQEVIVLDNGSGYLKIGFSGEDAPRAVLPTAIATLTDEAKEDEPAPNVDSTAAAKNQALYGDDAFRHFGQSNVNILRPVQRGEIQSTDAMKDSLENLWEHTFRNVLGVEQEELPILVADALPLGQSAYSSRQWVAEVMFEKFKVKALAIFNTAVLSLYSTGRTRGLVVESGEGLTQAVPVFEGYAIPHAIFKMEVAGWDITRKLQGMMGPRIGQEYASNPRVMQALKEKVCSISPHAALGQQSHDEADEEARSFELPDGKIIQVSHDVRMGAPEILFAGVDNEPAMQQICWDAISTCDMDFRKDLVKSLVVAGGTSMIPGLAPRLRNELSRLLPGDLASQVDICVDSQRKYAAWIGGSMFASLSTFDQVAITRQEFEDGKSDVRNLVARKTF
mmetsp:Transcript_60788/g.144828  ORF Transcript_60788/g.144828 Transcript_60788/m.144828 type:complete len:401 (-) Transcript_60788:129-1331(-)